MIAVLLGIVAALITFLIMVIGACVDDNLHSPKGRYYGLIGMVCGLGVYLLGIVAGGL